MDNVQQLLQEEIQKLHSTEKQLRAALPKMADLVGDDKLKAGLQTHVKQTNEQESRIDKVLGMLNMSGMELTDHPMEEIIREAERVTSSIKDPQLRDLAIASAANKIEHYEMGLYEGAIALAKKADMQDIANMLNQTLKEEEMSSQEIKMIAGNGMGRAVAGMM